MTPRSLARARIAGLALALAGGGLLMIPSPAEAGILDSPTMQAQIGFGVGGPAVCSASGPGNVVTPMTPFAANGLDASVSASSSRTFTNNSDGTDVTNMSSSISTTVRATAGADALSGLSMSTQFALSAQATEGTAQQCGGNTTANVTVGFNFDLPSPRAITLDSDGAGATYVATFQRISPVTPVTLFEVTSLGTHTTDHTTGLMPAGTYSATLQVLSSLSAPRPADPTTARTGTIAMTASFTLPGAAMGVATGDGGKYLTLADGRSCAAGSLAATWKSKAGKGKNRRVKKATFFVNDVKVATVKKPKKSQVSTLTGLGSGQPAVVEARIRLARKGAGTVTVERSYLTCT